MAVFKVCVLKDCTFECMVDVEADNEQDAINKAAIEANSSEHTEWVEDEECRELYGQCVNIH